MMDAYRVWPEVTRLQLVTFTTLALSVAIYGLSFIVMRGDHTKAFIILAGSLSTAAFFVGCVWALPWGVDR